MIDIQVDPQKCTSAQECRGCLEGCPQGVFHIYPANGRKPGVVTTDWAVRTLFLSLCTACGICRDICPRGAITVSVR